MKNKLSKLTIEKAVLRYEYKRIPKDRIEYEKSVNLVIDVSNVRVGQRKVVADLSFARCDDTETEYRENVEYSIDELREVLS